MLISYENDIQINIDEVINKFRLSSTVLKKFNVIWVTLIGRMVAYRYSVFNDRIYLTMLAKFKL